MNRVFYNTGSAFFLERVRELNLDLTPNFCVITFGCQQNKADSEKIKGMAIKMGYYETENPDDADLLILNTCAIREHAEMKSLSMLGRFKILKRKNPDLIIGLCGCMAAEPHKAEKLKEDFHYVSFTVEPNMLYRIPELVYSYKVNRKRSFVFGTDDGGITEGIPTVSTNGYQALVSIMYGCNNFCSYCIVPYVRGRERSRASDKVLEEARGLVSNGVKEITLLGQNVNSYKSDISFAELVEKIADIPGDFIIRFMTSHPKDVSDELIKVMAKYKGKVAPCFHLPLQSGSNKILKAMNRTYTRERFLEVVSSLRSHIPGIVLSTDIIIGFPGESDEDFEDTVDILSRVQFDLVYSFLYSPREGTPASKMQNRVSPEVMHNRMNRLLALQDGISLKKNEEYLNKTVRVLVDSVSVRDDVNIANARTDSGKLVHFESDRDLVGKFVYVEIDRVGAFDLFGKEKD